MAERGILFSAPMVRAILAGKKTQTRRLVNLRGLDVIEERDDGSPWPWSPAHDDWIACPHGRHDDVLWVRETHALVNDGVGVVYRADGKRGAWVGDGGGGRFWIHHGWTVGVTPPDDRKVSWYGSPDRWRPAIFLKRADSRIDLRVTSVRVERLRCIEERDILAEGVTVPLAAEMTGKAWSEIPDLHTAWRLGWDKINGKRAPWDSNPWVWVIGFEVIRG